MTTTTALPAGVTVFERGWLSANNVLLCDEDSATLVDSGYVTHQAQTLALVEQALQGRTLDQLVNTHLHSDHCGGNRALQERYPALQTWIPPGSAADVQAWREDALSYKSTGQNCPIFSWTGLLQPGTSHRWANMEWEVHAAPGHDPHGIILFAPEHRLLMSADALWQNGFGVVFPELVGVAAFDEVGDTLDHHSRTRRGIHRSRTRLGAGPQQIGQLCPKSRTSRTLRQQGLAQIQIDGMGANFQNRIQRLGHASALPERAAQPLWPKP
jgi:glyoxylase-like metal-dependent hydrolase (beta-lactamase superfamily II)